MARPSKTPKRMPIKPVTTCRAFYPGTCSGRTVKRTTKAKKVR